MKKMMILAFLFMAGAGTVMAQKKTTKAMAKAKTSVKVKAPEAVNTSFTTSYPEITNASWSKTAVDNYVASYTSETGIKEEIEYNQKGDIMRSRTTYTQSNVPEEVAKGIQARFAGATIDNAVKITLPGVAPYYNVKLKTAGEEGKEKNVLVSSQGLVSL